MDHRQDAQFLFDERAQPLQLVVYNQGQEPIVDASLALTLPNHNAFYVADAPPRRVVNKRYVDRTPDEIAAYPAVTLRDDSVQVMTKIGVSTQLLAGADIYPALERGVIDATEFSMPNMDINLGFYQIAKNNYFPGWHQQTSVSELLINKAKWDELPDSYRAIIEIAAGESIHHTYAETEGVNPFAMVEMGEKHGVIVERWTNEELAVFEQAWLDVLEEDATKDPLFKRVADSYLGFRTAYAKWGDAQRMEATYLK